MRLKCLTKDLFMTNAIILCKGFCFKAYNFVKEFLKKTQILPQQTSALNTSLHHSNKYYIAWKFQTTNDTKEDLKFLGQKEGKQTFSHVYTTTRCLKFGLQCQHENNFEL